MPTATHGALNDMEVRESKKVKRESESNKGGKDLLSEMERMWDRVMEKGKGKHV